MAGSCPALSGLAFYLSALSVFSYSVAYAVHSGVPTAGLTLGAAAAPFMAALIVAIASELI